MLFLALIFSDHCGQQNSTLFSFKTSISYSGICLCSTMWAKRLCRCGYLWHLGVERLPCSILDCSSEPAVITTVLLKERRWGNLKRRRDPGSWGWCEKRGQEPGIRAASKSWKRWGHGFFPGTYYWSILDAWPSDFKIINTSRLNVLSLWSFVIAVIGD